MSAIVPKIGFFVKRRLVKALRQCRSAGLRVRFLIVLNLSHCRTARETASVLGVHNTTVYRVAKRYRELGVWGLFDGREDNGTTKLDERVLDVILDNYRIHDSKITQVALAGFGERIRLHFLPPYCPNENRIERYWEDLHANVTRNHTCQSMEALMGKVRDYLWQRNRDQLGIGYYHQAA